MLEGQTYSNKARACVTQRSHRCLIHYIQRATRTTAQFSNLAISMQIKSSFINSRAPLAFWLRASPLLLKFPLGFFVNKSVPISLIKSMCKGAGRCVHSPLRRLAQVSALTSTLILLIRRVAHGWTDRPVSGGAADDPSTLERGNHGNNDKRPPF